MTASWKFLEGEAGTIISQPEHLPKVFNRKSRMLSGVPQPNGCKKLTETEISSAICKKWGVFLTFFYQKREPSAGKEIIQGYQVGRSDLC
jgi:hypothetical protein